MTIRHSMYLGYHAPFWSSRLATGHPQTAAVVIYIGSSNANSTAKKLELVREES